MPHKAAPFAGLSTYRATPGTTPPYDLGRIILAICPAHDRQAEPRVFLLRICNAFGDVEWTANRSEWKRMAKGLHYSKGLPPLAETHFEAVNIELIESVAKACKMVFKTGALIHSATPPIVNAESPA
jgi:hypothetical protein